MQQDDIIQDEIMTELMKIREEHAKSFNYDFEAIFEDWQKKQQINESQLISFSNKPNNEKIVFKNS
ncbi:hypothetical protein ACN4EE_13295 [Geminocystis sp. CENA526]|uniref:hypothetical protein n=1 Tax=Geminocystis sp. CENA526 TaxID=1355871 RepID=UPI003D6F203D